MQKLFLLVIAVALFLPNLYNAELSPVLSYNGKEKYDPSLSRLRSVAVLEQYTDSVATSKSIAPGSFEYVQLLEDVVEQKFYHGFSHYTTSENWIAAFAGKFLKEDYACKVQPDEILEHPNAACSQQALVMMAVLRDKHITYRSLGFPHHYAIEVLLDRQWYFFDTDMEPVITRQQRSAAQWQYRNDALKPFYDPATHPILSYQFGDKQTATIGEINEVPAQKAKWFHIATGLLSRIGWLFPLVLLFLRGGFNIEVPFVSLLMKRRRPLVSLSA